MCARQACPRPGTRRRSVVVAPDGAVPSATSARSSPPTEPARRLLLSDLDQEHAADQPRAWSSPYQARPRQRRPRRNPPPSNERRPPARARRSGRGADRLVHPQERSVWQPPGVGGHAARCAGQCPVDNREQFGRPTAITWPPLDTRCARRPRRSRQRPRCTNTVALQWGRKGAKPAVRGCDDHAEAAGNPLTLIASAGSTTSISRTTLTGPASAAWVTG
jgi:hypothetical protein